MNFLNRCSGYSMAQNVFSEKALAAFEDVIDDARKLVRSYIAENDAHEDRYYIGHRFTDNKTVLGRITSRATEEEFMRNPGEWAIDALRDCASADHWYTFEKQWD